MEMRQICVVLVVLCFAIGCTTTTRTIAVRDAPDEPAGFWNGLAKQLITPDGIMAWASIGNPEIALWAVAYKATEIFGAAVNVGVATGDTVVIREPANSSKEIDVKTSTAHTVVDGEKIEVVTDAWKLESD